MTPGQEERLRAVLRTIGNDIRGRELTEVIERPAIDVPSSRRIHFARFAMHEDLDRGPLPKRLPAVSKSCEGARPTAFGRGPESNDWTLDIGGRLR